MIQGKWFAPGADLSAVVSVRGAVFSRGADELDPEVVEEIYAWFKEEAASDSLAEALKALGDDYEEEEIRLVRIKFLCEVAS